MPADDVYFMRVFARSPHTPSPQEIASHLSGHHFEVRVVVEPPSLGVPYQGSTGWDHLRLFYADGRAPLELERQSLHGDEPLPDRLRELMDATADARDKRARQRILDFLAEASQVFELSIPPDFDWNAGRHLVSTELLNYLEKETEGMIQADEEGYYQNNRSVLKL